jgi:AmiR/NasT family two-component response regulator
MRAAMASRAAIEQAKGILMLLTSCGEQVAFDLLAHISSHTHRKVRDIAEVITRSAAERARLPEDVRAIIRDACPPAQPLR